LRGDPRLIVTVWERRLRVIGCYRGKYLERKPSATRHRYV